MYGMVLRPEERFGVCPLLKKEDVKKNLRNPTLIVRYLWFRVIIKTSNISDL
jgi:hypothetical protein